MSRIGKKPVPVPAGVKVAIKDRTITVEGPKGKLDFPLPEGISLKTEEGNVVVTDLTNTGMPFVRYVNGDRAVAGWTDCTCGRGMPLLKKVVGRQLDMIDTPDGRSVPGEFFPHLLKVVHAGNVIGDQ